MGGLSAHADDLTDAGPTSPGPTGLNNSLIELRFSLPQFPGRPAERLQRGALSVANHAFIVPDLNPAG